MNFVFHDKFVDLCNERGISPNKAAIEIGFNRTSISKWKKSGFTPQNKTLVKIAQYFGVSVDYLSGASENKISLSDSGETKENINIIKIVGRDGSYEERALTDDQLELFKKMIDALPEATDL